MIQNYSVRVHNNTGIVEIIINTTFRWGEYQINRLTPEIGKIQISLYDTNDDEVSKTLEVFKGFKWSDYIISSMQEKDQIYIYCIPDSLLMDHGAWKFIKLTQND